MIGSEIQVPPVPADVGFITFRGPMPRLAPHYGLATGTPLEDISTRPGQDPASITLDTYGHYPPDAGRVPSGHVEPGPAVDCSTVSRQTDED